MFKNSVEDWHYNKFRSNFTGRCRWTSPRKSQGWCGTTQRLKIFLQRSKGVLSPYFLANSFLLDGSRLRWLIAGRDFYFTKDLALLKDFLDFLSKPTVQDNMTKRVYERIYYHSAHYDRPVWSKWIHQCGFIDCTNDTTSMEREQANQTEHHLRDKNLRSPRIPAMSVFRTLWNIFWVNNGISSQFDDYFYV